MDSFWKQNSPCRRRRQKLGVNKTPPLDKEDFDLEEGGFLLSDRVYPIKLPNITYSAYKYEVNRIKTHEMRAK